MTMNKPDHIRFELRTFSDSELEAMLSGDANFRDMRIGHRNALLKAMREGWWDSGTGEPLIFGPNGELLNGQHRASAAQIYQRETGQQVWFWCAFGVRGSCGHNMDQGLTRRLVDYLRHEQVKHSMFASQIVIAQSRVASQSRAESLAVVAGQTQDTKVPSVAMCLDQWRRHRGAIEEWAAVGDRLHRKGLSRPGLLAAFGFQLAKQHHDRAIEFFDRLVDGENLSKGDPVLTLRERLLSERGKKTKLIGHYVGAFTIKAWVAWNRGIPLSILKWATVGPAAQPFPDHRIGGEEDQQ